MPLLIAGQITMTGSAIQLPAGAVLQGITLTAKAANTAVIAYGNSSSVTTSTGALIDKGTSVPLYFQGNANSIWVIGTASDVVSYSGA